MSMKPNSGFICDIWKCFESLSFYMDASIIAIASFS